MPGGKAPGSFNKATCLKYGSSEAGADCQLSTYETRPAGHDYTSQCPFPRTWPVHSGVQGVSKGSLAPLAGNAWE
jgi:hypothetical protein